MTEDPGKVLSFRMSRDVADRLKMAAIVGDETQNAIILRLLNAGLPSAAMLGQMIAQRFNPSA